jgi:phenylacetate-CoA ligase
MFDDLTRLEDICRIFLRSRLSRETVLRYQERKLRRVVARAYRRVPYYRSLFEKAGIAPRDIRCVSDLAKLPTTSKKDFKNAAPDSCLSDDARPARLHAFRTTGSTGVPLVLKRSGVEDFLFHLFRMRAIRYYGLRSRDRVIRIRSGYGYVPPSWRLFKALGFYRQSIMDTGDSPQKNAADLLALRPDVLTGYNSCLARIARIIVSDLGTTLPLRFAVGGADMLTPLLRRQIRDAFGAPIYDTYECQEVGFMGWECRKTGLYHVCDDNLIIEVLKDGVPAGEGEQGEVVVTSLHLKAMPFIRYRLEDIVTVGPPACPCGLPYSTLRTIEAKKQDYFRLPGGREFYPWAIALLLVDNAPWIMQFELVQERLDRIVMRAEARPQPSSGELSLLTEKVRPILGPGVDFQIEIVPELGTRAGGKFWVRRSLVSSIYDEEPGPSS